MEYQRVHGRHRIWGLARQQHGVVSRRQLLELGFHPQAIKRRIASGRLHPVRRGVYAVGSPWLSGRGLVMAAVLACGPRAAASHETAAALWGIRPPRAGPVEVSVPGHSRPRPRGVVVHRRRHRDGLTRLDGIPLTTPVTTLVDLATRLTAGQLEAAVNEADKRDLTDPEALRRALDSMAGHSGLAALTKLLDQATLTLTDSELERRFLQVVRQAGLPRPRTGHFVNGFRVDFDWPELGLVVETDGLRYHRTPVQQARDRLRDQAHTAAGLTPLRFTHAQIAFEPAQVQATAVVRRLLGRRVSAPAGAD
jgi:very-short-patch-repair endonuclease